MVAFCAVGFALGSGVSLEVIRSGVGAQTPQKPNSSTAANDQKLVDKKNPVVDLTADVIKQISGKDSTIYLVGNVAFHHNGAIIQCDSAARYTNKNQMEFFGKVIINKDSAYIYGDRVLYDEESNMAEVFSPLVKMIRGDAVLYSYNLRFNTKTNVAYFERGGVMTKGLDNTMESYRGEFNAEDNIVKFQDSVAMKTKDYDLKTDSLTYNLDQEFVTFLARTIVWDKDSSIMEAFNGFYFAKSETYEFFNKSYIVTKDNEMWADTMNYFSPMRQATMRRNVQILDTANRTIAFGDWAYYDDSLGVAILTKMPSVRSYTEDATDTTFMRSDTIYMTTYDAKIPIKDSLTKKLSADSLAIDSTINNIAAADSLVVDSTLINDSLTVINSTVDSTSKDSTVNSTQIEPMVENTAILKIDSVKNEGIAIDSTTNDPSIIDSTISNPPIIDSTLISGTIDSLAIDSMLTDILAIDSLVIDSMLTDSALINNIKVDSAANDTLYTIRKERIIRAFYNVKMWSKENQLICDSVISYSIDSTAELHGSPIIWNENNQVTSEEIIIHTANEEVDWVEFLGDPFITQLVEPKYVEPQDTGQFNQAKSKFMNVYFRNNEVDSVVMNGNVINFYYMESDGYTSAFAKINCAQLVAFLKQRDVVKMRWEGKSDYQIFPIDKIPADQSNKIDGFSWRPELRPKNAKEISDRELKPSKRKEITSIKMPPFMIEDRIKNYKEFLIKEGNWRDRTDVNTITVDYFTEHNEML